MADIGLFCNFARCERTDDGGEICRLKKFMSKTNEAQRHYRQTGIILITVTILALWLLIGGFPIVISQSNTIFPTETVIGDIVLLLLPLCRLFPFDIFITIYLPVFVLLGRSHQFFELLRVVSFDFHCFVPEPICHPAVAPFEPH